MEQDFIDGTNGENKVVSKLFPLLNIRVNKKVDILLHVLVCSIALFFIIKATISIATTANPTIENLGVQFQALNSGPGIMFFDANGDPHWFVVFSGKAQFIDVNLKTGEKRYFNTGKGGLGTSTKALSGNKLFVFVGDACSVWEYNITTGNFTELKQAGSSNGCGLSTVAQSSYTAPDGMVYVGTAHKSTVYEIDPATGVIRDFGVIDPPPGNPTCVGCPSRMVSNVVADANYLYLLMRDTSTNSWWLAILNRSDGSLSASCGKNNLIPTGGVAASTDGTQIWYTNNSGSYRIDNTNGQCPTTTGTPPSLKPWYYPSNVYSTDGDAYAKAVSVFGADIDASNIEVDTSNGGVSTLAYRYPAGSGNWTQVTQQVSMSDSQIKRIKAIDNTNLYLVSGTYGPNSIFNGNSSTVLGRTTQSTYAATLAGQYVYFSGYTANTYRYTPTLPWSITGAGTACNTSSPSNPCLAFQGMGKYHYYSKTATNGNLYIASDYKRGSRGGGDIGWINPNTGATGSYAITCDAPAGFALLSDGVNLAYSGSGEAGSFGCTNTVGKVFIFNTNTNTLTTSFTAVPGSDNQGTIIDTNDGGIFGIIKNYPNTGSYTMYKVDANGNHASWSPKVSTGAIFGSTNGADQFLVKSRDGIIYTVGDNNEVIKINPADGSRTSYTTASSWITTMEFVGDDLYMAVGSNSSTLQRIKGINPPIVVTPPQTTPVNNGSTTPNQSSPVVNSNTPVVDPTANLPKTSSTKTITGFNFNNISPAVVGIINETNHTVSLTVPSGTDITNLTPSVTIEGSYVNPNSGVAQNFSSPVTYTVTAANGSTQSYLIVVSTIPKNIIPEEKKPEVKNTEVKKEVVSIINKSIFNRNLRVGLAGNDVKELQSFLNMKGFSISKKGPGSPGKETKSFGISTKKALIKFQKANGLKPDGVAGPATRSKIKELAK